MLLGLTKALAVFKDLMNPACAQSVKVVHIVFIDDILIYSKSKEDYEVYLKLVLELLKKEKLDKVENVTAEILRGLDQLMERKEGRDMYLLWVPLIGDARTLMMDEAHASRYLVQSRADKTYYDLRDMYVGHKYLADTNLHVHLEEIKVDKTLHFVEEPVEIIDCEVKILKRSRIPIVKSIGTRTYDSKEEPIEEESLPIESNEKVKLEESGEGRMADFRSLVGYLVAGFGPCGVGIESSRYWLSSVERVPEEIFSNTALRTQSKEVMRLFEVGVGAAEEGKKVCLPCFPCMILASKNYVFSDTLGKQRIRSRSGPRNGEEVSELRQFVEMHQYCHCLMAPKSLSWGKDVLAALGRHFIEGSEKHGNLAYDLSSSNGRTKLVYHSDFEGYVESVFDVLSLKHCMEGSCRITCSLVMKLVKFRSIGPRMVQRTTNKVILIKENLKAARDCQKSYVGNMRKHLELKLVIK
ncbi:hypothetical protein Tco_0121488 [Tanacetum coccineum]